MQAMQAMQRALVLVVWLAFAAACGGGGADRPQDAGVDASGPPDASCFENPQTHAEIINACTTAQKVTKKPNLPLLQPGGALPPLPP
jgi:hypothetical protein